MSTETIKMLTENDKEKKRKENLRKERTNARARASCLENVENYHKALQIGNAIVDNCVENGGKVWKTMRTMAIINLKGGVGKTVTVVNVAYLLAAVHKKRVLVIDCDKQGNASGLFGIEPDSVATLAELLTEDSLYGQDCAVWVSFDNGEGMEIIPADMRLLGANYRLSQTDGTEKYLRLTKFLGKVNGEYDYCVIDCAPDINPSTLNAIAAADDVIIPMTTDAFAVAGAREIAEQVENIAYALGWSMPPRICPLVTQMRKNCVYPASIGFLCDDAFTTKIRYSPKVPESIAAREPLETFSPQSAAARDYRAFVREYLARENGYEH
jgi:chromosome partitioning protein